METKKVIVLKEFSDKNDLRKKYKVGDVIKDFDEARIANLIERGLAGYEGGAVSDINISEAVSKVLPQIKVFEDVEKLKLYLTQEKASDKPRETVVKAIEARIANLVGAEPPKPETPEAPKAPEQPEAPEGEHETPKPETPKPEGEGETGDGEPDGDSNGNGNETTKTDEQ